MRNSEGGARNDSGTWWASAAIAGLLLVYLGGYSAIRANYYIATSGLNGMAYTHTAFKLRPGCAIYFLPDTVPGRALATLYKPLFWMTGDNLMLLRY